MSPWVALQHEVRGKEIQKVKGVAKEQSDQRNVEWGEVAAVYVKAVAVAADCAAGFQVDQTNSKC